MGDDSGKYLKDACQMARHAMRRSSWVDEDGTLTERGAYGKDNHEAWKNDDAVGFKAILLRSLAKLYMVLRDYDLDHELQNLLRAFVQKQFDSLQQKNTNHKGQYGPWWNGPMDTPTSHSQLAALDVMASIHLVAEH